MVGKSLYRIIMRFKVGVKQADRFFWMILFHPNVGQNEGDTRIDTVAGASLARNLTWASLLLCNSGIVLMPEKKKCSAPARHLFRQSYDWKLREKKTYFGNFQYLKGGNMCLMCVMQENFTLQDYQCSELHLIQTWCI